MGTELEDQYDQIILGAADKAGAFLGVLQKRCQEQGLEINLQPAKRGFRDATVVLRGAIKAGRGNTLQLEVFADVMANNLHVGWQLSRPVAGGSALGNIGIFGEMNAMARRGANKTGNVRAQSGIMQAFQGIVFLPVLEELTYAVQQSKGPQQNGFLGA